MLYQYFSWSVEIPVHNNTSSLFFLNVQVVVSEKCETFVEQWMKENMPELGRVKAPLMTTRTDQNAVEDFIRQVNVTDLDLKYK